MINFENFYKKIADSPLASWLKVLPQQLLTWQKKSLHGHFHDWVKCVKNLPLLIPDRLDLLHGINAYQQDDLTDIQRINIESLLRNLMPWRKGPYLLYGIKIDTEWRCDWKWQRLLPYLSPLKGRTVLDVGCGNGYYMWRMIGAGADAAIGIDPNQLFLCQFEAIRKLLGNDHRLHLLPLCIEQQPSLKAFDTVFSMGMLYHRRSPLDYLIQLKNQLVQNGELVLETLVINGDKNTVLVPSERYAKMRNVYFIPSARALKNWLKKCGLVDIRIVDYNTTVLEEQRRTKWMTRESLADFLDPNDITKTIEGYSAPLRAVLIARKP
ncbi:tRNA 5-methoxyuridine(34)/uridine 5-oxyacetic acid(34) synthase CmoB [Candidatus Pantoea carbekii]|uniref:tRNA U34 carboxymethyltransferase n=1 Tax=Candidatus Pantoea carbekii TaxID=1235990 RepID=U3U7Y3_9GAMM|nr:tRNA 5-methoxyuridine(34)/uridine 5-oxyacetic acid(34) synthase CmoB [Candidatus Pantoea carbekii]AKC32039.1 methyltransferase YecP [Candidatus Pantoea carbekii]BAO00562.1 hypothetical protein HHS_05920 [Candidatus Pantoea carbekii]